MARWAMPPQTEYARSGRVHIAYQVVGDPDPARPDLVLSYGYGSNVEVQWEHPRFAWFLDQLADLGRLVLYDKRREQRGTGAAALVQRRCQACRLELDRTALAELRAAPPDEVVYCEECGVILVRTPESGL